MDSKDSTRIGRRGKTLIVTAVLGAALTVGAAAPGWAAASPTTSAASEESQDSKHQSGIELPSWGWGETNS